jgi:hypothetical protein
MAPNLIRPATHGKGRESKDWQNLHGLSYPVLSTGENARLSCFSRLARIPHRPRPFLSASLVVTDAIETADGREFAAAHAGIIGTVGRRRRACHEAPKKKRESAAAR